YEEKVLVKENDLIKVIEIGKFIDECIDKFGCIREGIHEICDLPVEIYTLSLDKDEKVRWKPIKSVIRHHFNGKLIKLKTKSGRIITATPYHSFVIKKDNEIVPIEGKKLKIGDKIPVIKNIPLNCISYIEIPNNLERIMLDYDLGYAIGVYLANGYCNGIEFIKNFDTVKIIEISLSSNKEFVRGLLKGYLDINGKIDEDIKIYVSSKELLDGLALLLSRFGIFSVKKDSILEIPKDYSKKLMKVINLELLEEDDKDVVWDEIVLIEEVEYNKYVYDFSVEGLETFTTFEGVVTHNTMRTFHYAGVAELNVTLGLPRMIEIVDARKEPSTPIMEVHLIDEYKYNKEKAEEVAKQIEGLTLKDVAKSISIDLWTQSIKVELDEDVIKDRGLDIEEIKEAIRKKVKVKIEEDGNILYLKVKTPSIKSLRKRIPKIKNILLKGIPGITRVLVKKDENTGEYVIHTQGSNLREVFKIEGVDTTRTITNNIIEIQEVLGIEAARNAIINEMRKTLEQQGLEVDIRHLMLVADMMTADGEVKPIGRHGVAGEKGSVLARAAFEETVKHLYSAAEKGEVDRLKGVIENVIVGKPIFLGTGCVKLEIDRDYEEGRKE
ncbi:DNA-directed RNA polymerase subunit A'', partial [Methanocaldococcus sp.]